MREATAIAHPNIALAKYWGKADSVRNLPATPSLSLTLGPLATTTRVSFDPSLGEDTLELNGSPATAQARERVVHLLDRVRELAGTKHRARITSSNDFPTAAGLASSSSGFAALALAATRAAGLELSQPALSALARSSSASAARSVFGGYVSLPAQGEHAVPVAPAEHFPLRMLVCVVRSGPKVEGSTRGMLRTQATSPYYAAWLAAAPVLYAEIFDALKQRDLEKLGAAAEQSALAMHASMWAARPSLNYFVPATLAVLGAVRELRAQGWPAYFTLDAGPNVKVLTVPERASALATELQRVPGVESSLVCHGGPDAHLVDNLD